MDILDNPVLSALSQQLKNGSFRVWHHSSRAHKARFVQECFHEMGAKELAWPACGPDLSPIKHICMDWYAVAKPSSNGPTLAVGLALLLCAEWNKMESLPRRVEAVTAVRGRPTH